jgi:cytochrome c oxidase subunit II
MKFCTRSITSRLTQLVAATLVLLTLGGCSLNREGHQSALDPKGPLAQNQYDLFMLTLAVTLFLFITVGGTLAYTVWRFRLRKGEDPNRIPPQSHGHPLIEVGLILASTALLVVIAIPTFTGIVLMKRLPAHLEADAIEINVYGYQWWWAFEYPEHGFYTANELVIPIGRAVKLNLHAQDVIHSFWLPKLSGKTDLIPGQVNEMWIKAWETGEYWGQCAEFCGDSHAYMLFRAHAVSSEDYTQWLETQQELTIADRRTLEPVAGIQDEAIGKGLELFRNNCLRCHSLIPQEQTMGPNLAHFATRSTLAAGWLDNTPENLFRWLKYPDRVKPGNYMYRGFLNPDGRTVLMEGLKDVELSDDDIHALIAYLYSLR